METNTITITNNTKNYRAYDTITEWMGPPRATVEEAYADCDEHDQAHHHKGGGVCQSIVGVRNGDRLYHLTGSPVWPPWGNSSGAVQWL